MGGVEKDFRNDYTFDYWFGCVQYIRKAEFLIPFGICVLRGDAVAYLLPSAWLILAFPRGGSRSAARHFRITLTDQFDKSPKEGPHRFCFICVRRLAVERRVSAS